MGELNTCKQVFPPSMSGLQAMGHNLLAPIQKGKAVVGMQVYSIEWSNIYGGSRIPDHKQANMDKDPLINHYPTLVFMASYKG